MEATYNIIAGDGKEYGPITLAQLQSWIDEGRITPEMQLFRSDQTGWKTAEQFGELHWENLAPGTMASAEAASPVAAPTTPVTTRAPIGSVTAAKSTPRQLGSEAAADIAVLSARVDRSAKWFYWIAGLSAVNSVVSFLNLGIAFVLGLGITQFFDEMAKAEGEGGLILLLPSAVGIGIFFLFGFFARKGHSWAFIFGMIIYALDAGLCVVFEIWLSVAFHVLALYYIFLGFIANQKRKSRMRGA